MLKKLFRPARAAYWNIVEKETIEEVIFKTIRDRQRGDPETHKPVNDSEVSRHGE